MDFDKLIEESMALKPKRGRKKKEKKETTPAQPRVKPMNPCSSVWMNVSAVVLSINTKCRCCSEDFKGIEPHIFLKKVRKRKLGVPDIHYQKISGHALVNVYSNLPREIMEVDRTIDFCIYCFPSSPRQVPVQQPLDLDPLIGDEVIDLLEELRK